MSIGIKNIKSVKKWKNAYGDEISYKVTTNNDVIWYVPWKSVDAAGNTDYQDVLEWEKIEGNTIEEAD